MASKEDLVISTWHTTAVANGVASRINPAQDYLAQLQSKHSKETMASVVRSISAILGFEIVDADANGQEVKRGDPLAVPWYLLDARTVSAVMETLTRDHKSMSTLNVYLSALKGIARHAMLNGQMSAQQFTLIDMVRSRRGSRLPAGRALHAAEVSNLVDHCLTSEGLAGIRDAALLGILFGCGPRRAEVVTIDIGKLNFTDRSVRVIGKGNKERELEMPTRTIDLVNVWLEESGLSQGALFRPITRHGEIRHDRRLTPGGVYNIVTRRIAQAGLEKASPHDLRRSFLTYLLDNGVDLSTAADLAGHSSTDTTRRYLRGQKRRNREAADKVEF